MSADDPCEWWPVIEAGERSRHRRCAGSGAPHLPEGGVGDLEVSARRSHGIAGAMVVLAGGIQACAMSIAVRRKH
eukprot:14387236-Alexandrium_andersonii.AAC.1